MTRGAAVCVVLLVGAALVVVGAVRWVGASGDPAVRPGPAAHPVPAGCPVPSGRPTGGPSDAVAAVDRDAARVPGAAVLHAWDRRRARAYADGDAAALRGLYVRGSVAGERDVRTLRRYDRRGFRVVGMRMQVLALEVLAHRRGLWRLEVTDRLQRASAVRHGTPVALPRDAASTRVVTLVRSDDGWRVRSVAAPRARAG